MSFFQADNLSINFGGIKAVDRVTFDAARYGRARRAFGTPRFFAAYREWLRGGDAALGRLLSPALSDAWRAGSGTLETLVLPYVYADLSELVQTA